MDALARLPRPLGIRWKVDNGRVRVVDQRKGLLRRVGADEAGVLVRLSWIGRDEELARVMAMMGLKGSVPIFGARCWNG